MNTSKIIKAIVNARGQVTTAQTIKENYGIILKIEGAELPEVYQVDFCNEGDTRTITMVGNADGVLIPKQFIDTGKDIDAYLYYVGDGFGKTVYQFHIPNKYRPDRTNEQPTPEEQSVIDQAIDALNEAVEQTAQDKADADASAQSASADADRAEDAKTDAQNYATAAEGYVYIAQGYADTAHTQADNAQASAEASAQSAQSAEQSAQTASAKADAITGLTATAQTLPDGSSATASYDAQTGTLTLGIPKGRDGTNGDNGYSPTASVSKSGKTTTITITDKNGTTSAQVEDGTDGTDGYSPSVTITPITGGHRITITDADGEHSADVMDGIGNVDDVQINETSIVEDGVANIPIASDSNLGAVKTESGGYYGINVNSSGRLALNPATSTQMKTGTGVYRPIVSSEEHTASFYGLAKSAGDTTQSASSNAVGMYTEDAKIAIQKMLGIYEAPWELIREDTFTNAEEADHIIDVDANGEEFELTEAVILFETPKQETQSSMGGSGSIYLQFNRGNAKKVECGAWTQAADASAHGCGAVLLRHGNLVELGRIAYATNSNSGALGYRYGMGFGNIGIASDRLSYAIDNDNSFVGKIVIKSVLGTGHYKLYGRRK